MLSESLKESKLQNAEELQSRISKLEKQIELKNLEPPRSENQNISLPNECPEKPKIEEINLVLQKFNEIIEQLVLRFTKVEQDLNSLMSGKPLKLR